MMNQSRRRVRRFFALATAAIMCAAPTADAADAFRKLGDAEIKAKIAGMEITDDIHWTEQYMRDGSFKSWFMSRQLKGKWRAEGGQLCIDDGTPDAGCKEVWLSGMKVEFRFEAGRVLEGMLQKQQPRG